MLDQMQYLIINLKLKNGVTCSKNSRGASNQIETTDNKIQDNKSH